MAAMLDLLSRCGEFRDPDHTKKNFFALNEQRNISRFCDVVLRVCNTEIYAHANVLAAASPYFNSFLGMGNDCPRTFSPKQPQIIEIHIDSVMMNDGDGGYGEAVSKVVDYMYTSEIILTTTLVSQIIEIGKIMLLDKLLEFCCEFQKGINSNKPCSISTCTSGLQEVASLLSARSRIIKRSDAATETDEKLFARLRCPTPVSFENEDMLSEIPLKLNPLPRPTITNSVQEIISPHSDGKDKDVSEKCIVPDLIDNDKETPLPSIATSGIDEAPSIFDTFEQSSATIAELQNEVAVENKNEANLPQPPCLDSSSTEPLRDQVHATVDCLDNFNAIESFAEILDAPSPKVFPVAPDNEKSELQETAEWQPQDQNVTLPIPQGFASVSDDLIPFDSFSSSKLTYSQRGRSRGRKRKGRGRRGRPPGRPKKVEDPDSDPEFDAFMTRLEKGNDVKGEIEIETARTQAEESMDYENTDLSSVSDLSSRKEDPDYVPVNVKKELTASEAMWKSPRVRTKPSQLKKDYIFHSLSRKTRRPRGAATAGHEPITVNKQISKRNTKAPGKLLTSLRFVCQKCDFSSTNIRDYRQHLRSHPETDPRYLMCPKCDYKTTKAREFTTHKKMHMTRELICFYCEFQAITLKEYQEHIDKHNGEFPYFCTECDSKFKKKNQLMSHKPKHQLEKPFVCAVCGSGFKWKHALKNHMITHSTTKDHLCDVCGYATAHKSQLKAHRLVHTGQTFKCSIPGCHFEATKRQKLKYHMVTHTHEKPHQCDVCGQRFSLNKNMRRHMLLHTNFRPYACKMCSFTTTRYDKLKEHNFKLHNIGEAPVPKKVALDFLGPNVTYVRSEIKLNPDGSFSEETLQKIAQLATSHQVSTTDLGMQQTTINIEQPSGDGSGYPIIARVHYAQVDDGGLQYIAEITE